jgi:uncharacterized protein YkwD
MIWSRYVRRAVGVGIGVLVLAGCPRITPSVAAQGGNLYTVVMLPIASQAAHANPGLEAAVLHWLNRVRGARRLPPLHDSPAMRRVARGYGFDLFAHGYLSHVSRDGRTLQDRLAPTGLQSAVIGENLAYAATVRDAERALWQSPSHRVNILYPKYRTVGVAVIDGGNEGVIVVQDFADHVAGDFKTPSRPVDRAVLSAPHDAPAAGGPPVFLPGK